MGLIRNIILRRNKCLMCGKIKWRNNSGKYATIDYPNKINIQNATDDIMYLAINFVCNKCAYMEDKQDVINLLKRHNNISIYDLERLGLIKKLKGDVSR